MTVGVEPEADETVVQVSFSLMPDKGTLNKQECTDNQVSVLMDSIHRRNPWIPD